MMLRWPLALSLALLACAPSTAPEPEHAVEPAPSLAQPNVVMAADPPPPFTYWAPEGATITNHGDVPDIWHADLNGARVATYFGDACHASQFQHLIGEPLQSVPPAPPGATWRTACTTCPVNDDLRYGRLNVLFDEETGLVERIACY